MTAGVYAIINTMTGCRYIGSTKDFKTRSAAHRSAIRNKSFSSNRRLIDDIEQYGASAFSVEMLEEVEPLDDALENAERRWIAQIAEADRSSLYNVEMTGRRPKTAKLCECWRCSERRKPRQEGTR